ncbi:MAG: ABC transporter permease [Anaerolineales bacterium]|nr:ABC transporter permease [Anaerolineales bacterium]
MNLQLTLAWRYLTGRVLRTTLTTFAVIFGVMVIFGMNIVLPTMMEGFKANMMAAGGVVDVTVTHVTTSAFPAEVAHKLDGIPSIRAYSASLERTVNLPPDFVDDAPARPDRISAVNLVGVEPEAARSLQVYLIDEPGRFLQAGDTNAAVISQSLADAWGVRLGETISLPSVDGLTELTIVGILPPRTRPGNEEVLVTLAQAQAMTGQPGQINTIRIALTSVDESARAEAVAAIESALGSDYQIGSLDPGSEMFASLKLGQAAFNMFGVLALFMGGFIIFNTFRTVVAERRRDIGMLRALGATRRTITGAILTEGLVQGVLGSLIGLALGYLLGALVVRLAAEPMKSFLNINMGRPVISPALVITSLLLGVGVTLLSTLLPARNASCVTPMDALRPSVAEVEYKRRAGASFIAGVVMIGIALIGLVSGNMGLIALGGLLFLGGLILVAPLLLRPIAWAFGHLLAWFYARQGIADLAQGNLTRQPGRVTVTASATLIGLAIIVALGGMTTSLTGMMGDLLHKTLGSDYLFIPPSIAVWNSDMGASPQFAARLREVEGVEAVTSLRFAAGAVNGQAVSVLALDPQTYPQVAGLDFTEGNEAEAYAALASGRNMIVNGAFLATLGVKVGETVEMTTPNGPRPYTIVAEAMDLLNAKVVTVYISHANLAADFGRTDDVFIMLNLKPGVALEDVDAQIKAIAADYPQFTVMAGKKYIDDMMQYMNAVWAVMFFLLIFLSIPSLIAMMNTLAINVIERTREIGMVRAVGATRKQVHRMVVAEALLLAAVGTAFGILAGLYLGYVIVSGIGVMFPVAYQFPLAGVLAGLAVGLLFGALAAVIPARQAAQLQVVEALRYE